jgi:hypothetical protein
MSLPYKPESAAIRPTAIKGMANGQLAKNVLEPCGIRSFVLEREAARSMRALVKKARRDGIPLSATGTYRSYDGQVNLFKRRYDNVKRSTRHEFWRGLNWWLKPKVAGAAVPGTSNHGWGLAVDFSLRNKLGQEKPLNTAALSWLTKNGPSFGWWNTTHSENWHWCWCLGDGPMPAAVLAEEGDYPNPPVPVIHPVLRVGDTGEDVKILQMKLNKVGANLLVDGQFGPRTEQAVRTFQTVKNITSDGIVGPETWNLLK